MWFFHNREELICKQVWEIGQTYLRRMNNPKGRPKNRIKNPVHLVKVMYWIFLSGARQQEAFAKPYPTLSIVNKDGGTYVVITHVNEKHKNRNGLKDVTTSTIPIFDVWEQKMWNFITDGNTQTEASEMFGYRLWKSTENSAISYLFSRNFKTDLEDPEDHKVHKKAGILPHILRHMRTYNVLIDHNMRKYRDIVQIWFGWNDQYMIDYYAHIRELMDRGKQIQTLQEGGVLTDLRVDAGMVFTSE